MFLSNITTRASSPPTRNPLENGRIQRTLHDSIPEVKYPLYSAGHNIVIYSIEDRQMQFLPGLEGSLGITSVTLCPKHRFLAVAERAERAIIFVYDMGKQRKKRALVTSDCLSQEYISLSFAPKQEKKFLISLGGPPD